MSVAGWLYALRAIPLSVTAEQPKGRQRLSEVKRIQRADVRVLISVFDPPHPTSLEILPIMKTYCLHVVFIINWMSSDEQLLLDLQEAVSEHQKEKHKSQIRWTDA